MFFKGILLPECLQTFCRIINCSNSLESILHFFHKKVRLLKSPNAAEQSGSSKTSVSPNLNPTQIDQRLCEEACCCIENG